MTDDVRNLIRFVVDGDIRNAQTQCRIMLEKNVPEKDARFKENELRKLNLLKPELIQLPANLESLLIAEGGAAVSGWHRPFMAHPGLGIQEWCGPDSLLFQNHAAALHFLPR